MTRALVLVVLAAVALSGCGGLGALSTTTASSSTTTASTSLSTTTTSAASKAARADATHEVPTPPPPSEHAAPGTASPSAAAAVRGFATAYINWSAGSVKDDLLRLAARSVGQARSAMTLEAAQTAGDYELHQGGIGNSGTVEAVAPLPGRPEQFVVVTREQTSAANSNAYTGLRPAWHVTVASVRRAATGGWVVSGWQPES